MRRIAPGKRQWDFYPVPETEFKIRELAALNTLRESEVVTRLIYLALKDGTEFVSLPPGTRLNLARPRGRKLQYMVPEEVADYMDGLVAMGFSPAYVGERLLHRGLEIVRSRKNPGEGALVGQWDTDQNEEGSPGPDLDTLRERAMSAILPPENRSPEPVRQAEPGVLRQVAGEDRNDDSPSADEGADVPDDGSRAAVGDGATGWSPLVGPPNLRRIYGRNCQSKRQLEGWNGRNPPATSKSLRHEGCGGLIGEDLSLEPYWDDEGLHFPARCECGAILSGPLARKDEAKA